MLSYHTVSVCGMVLELQTLIKNDKRSHTKKILTNITSTEACLDKTRESIEALLKEIASIDLSEHMSMEEWISPMVGQLLASEFGLWLVYEYPEPRQAISLPMLQEKPFADSDETLFFRVVCHRVGFRLTRGTGSCVKGYNWIYAV